MENKTKCNNKTTRTTTHPHKNGQPHTEIRARRTRGTRKPLTEDNADYIAYAIGCGQDYPQKVGGAAYQTISTKDGELSDVKVKGFMGKTSNYLQLMAIMSAVNSVPKSKSVIVYTHSQYAANIMSGEWEAKKHTHLLENYKAIAKDRKVAVRWMGFWTSGFFKQLQDTIQSLHEMQGVEINVHGRQRMERQKEQTLDFQKA